ncbi:expressed unknown protein [Seminavis robusta]|uniref:Uncharacterized protein n=1 Tax=Seminavis robusta TaxID=568900 RepID=A0A9N8DTP2_9STRA|nr:expressed unknown protein [Seminavis robusta]|eukprot:Sro242_g096710.1 n/a (866) ;mRNA; f:75820-78417
MIPQETLTEENLQQWDSRHQPLKDPPGLVRDDSYARGDGWSPTNTTSEDTEDEEIHLVEGGDDEDDGLFIGATSHDDDDSTIAFSDIVLPTEEEDPFLLELAAEEAARDEELQKEQVPQAPTSDDAILSSTPTDTPTEAPKMIRRDDQEEPESVRFSAHVIVAHALERKRAQLAQLTQAQLLAKLEERLRPYMHLPKSLPPLRRRKRPNCLFLNHMGTRRPPAPKKRKMAAASVAMMKPLKKRVTTAPTPTHQQEPVAAAVTPEPTPITAPSSPQRVVAPVTTLPSCVGSPMLPKLLTDSMWQDDLVQDPPSRSEELSVEPPVPFQAEEPLMAALEKPSEASIPDKPAAVEKPPSAALEQPLAAVENVKSSSSPTMMSTPTGKKRDSSKPKVVKKRKRASTSRTENKVKKTKATPAMNASEKEREDAKRKEVFKVIMASMTPSPHSLQANKNNNKSHPMLRNKPQKAADPPGEKPAASVVTPMTTTTSRIRQGDNEEMSLASLHEPLDPSLENSFQYVPSRHHDDVLSSLANGHDDDLLSAAHSNHEEEDHHLYDSPKSVAPRRVKVMSPPEETLQLHDDLDEDHDDHSGEHCLPSNNSTKLKKQIPPPSFVTLDTRSLPPNGGRGPRRFVSMAHRPMLLSPEMDVVAPCARYAGYDDPYELAIPDHDDHMSPSSPLVAPRRVIHMSSPKMPMSTRPDYQSSELYYARRTSLPYASLSMDYWSPTSPKPIVTPDAFASPYRRTKVLHPESMDHGDMMMMSLDVPPCPPLLTVHPHDGYHSPVSYRRVIRQVPPTRRMKTDDSHVARAPEPQKKSSTKPTPNKSTSPKTKKRTRSLPTNKGAPKTAKPNTKRSSKKTSQMSISPSS